MGQLFVLLILREPENKLDIKPDMIRLPLDVFKDSLRDCL
jgi:hypothetical protein